jgi:hypothetical protein
MAEPAAHEALDVDAIARETSERRQIAIMDRRM